MEFGNSNAIVLTTAWEGMFETHTRFQLGEIDFNEAKSELSFASNFISFAKWDSTAAYQNETVANLLWRLETEMGNLIELIDSTEDDEIGSAEVLDALFFICGPLFDLQSEIVSTAMDAGLTGETIDEIDPSESELFDDFYEML